MLIIPSLLVDVSEKQKTTMYAVEYVAWATPVLNSDVIWCNVNLNWTVAILIVSPLTAAFIYHLWIPAVSRRWYQSGSHIFLVSPSYCSCSKIIKVSYQSRGKVSYLLSSKIISGSNSIKPCPHPMATAVTLSVLHCRHNLPETN